MRKSIVVFVSLVLVCYGQATAQSGRGTGQRKITIGMIGKMGNNPVFIAAYAGARVAAKELGTKNKVDVVIDWQTPPEENVQEQAAALDRLSRASVQGIAIACSDASYLSPLIDKVVNKGIPVMCFDSDAPQSKRFAYNGADDVEFGRMLMRQLASEVKGSGTIAVLAGYRNALNLQRRLQRDQGRAQEVSTYRTPS